MQWTRQQPSLCRHPAAPPASTSCAACRTCKLAYTEDQCVAVTHRQLQTGVAEQKLHRVLRGSRPASLRVYSLPHPMQQAVVPCLIKAPPNSMAARVLMDRHRPTVLPMRSQRCTHESSPVLLNTMESTVLTHSRLTRRSDTHWKFSEYHPDKMSASQSLEVALLRLHNECQFERSAIGPQQSKEALNRKDVLTLSFSSFQVSAKGVRIFGSRANSSNELLCIGRQHQSP